MNILYLIGLFVLGVLFGSFGSVIVSRMRYKISWQSLKAIAVGRSKCPSCHHTLQRYDLLPLYSWFRVGGKCRYCKKKISSMYPILEIVSGLIFVLWGVVYALPALQGRETRNFFMLGARRLLGLLLVRDSYTYELHVPLWFFLLVVVVIYSVFALIQGFASRDMLFIPAVFFGVFFAVYRLGKLYVKYRFGKSQEGFGQGDVMLAPLLGFLLALNGVGSGSLRELALLFILGSSFIGIIYYAFAWIVQRYTETKTKKHSTGAPMIPFLPAMIICYRVIVLLNTASFRSF